MKQTFLVICLKSPGVDFGLWKCHLSGEVRSHNVIQEFFNSLNGMVLFFKIFIISNLISLTTLQVLQLEMFSHMDQRVLIYNMEMLATQEGSINFLLYVTYFKVFGREVRFVLNNKFMEISKN